MRTHSLLGLLMLSLPLAASGCSSAAEADEEENAGALSSANEKEYSFRYEFPANDLFARPFTKTIPVDIEKDGVHMHAVITPTAKIQVTSPIVQGKLTFGQSRLLSKVAGTPVPKILDAELETSSTYSTQLDVDMDISWNTTERKDVKAEIVREFQNPANFGKAIYLAEKLGAAVIPVTDDAGQVHKDLPLKSYYDIAVTCSFDEIDGDVQGVFKVGAQGSVVARAIYNGDNVVKRVLKHEKKKKFELDASDFTMNPGPRFELKGARQHVKGSCAVQPMVVVAFDVGVGLRLRVDARSSFDTQVQYQQGNGVGLTLNAKPELAIWGETDIDIPILHKTIDLEKQLYSKQFPEVNVDATIPTP